MTNDESARQQICKTLIRQVDWLNRLWFFVKALKSENVFRERRSRYIAQADVRFGRTCVGSKWANLQIRTMLSVKSLSE